MARKSELDSVIAKIDAEIAELQQVRNRIIAQKTATATAPATSKRKRRAAAVAEPPARTGI